MTPKFAIGQQFKTRGWVNREYGTQSKTCTVIDILRTYNSQDQLVKIRYVATHVFMGQTITDYDVLETTIARGYCEPA